MPSTTRMAQTVPVTTVAVALIVRYAYKSPLNFSETMGFVQACKRQRVANLNLRDELMRGSFSSALVEAEAALKASEAIFQGIEQAAAQRRSLFAAVGDICRMVLDDKSFVARLTKLVKERVAEYEGNTDKVTEAVVRTELRQKLILH